MTTEPTTTRDAARQMAEQAIATRHIDDRDRMMAAGIIDTGESFIAWSCIKVDTLPKNPVRRLFRRFDNWTRGIVE